MGHLILPVYLTLAFLLAGTVKGIAGIGMPTTVLGLMTLVIDPRSAIAFVLIPMLCANGWQVYRQGDVLGALRRYLPFGLALVIGVWITLNLTRNAGDRLLLGVLGAAILIFVIINLLQWMPKIPDRLERMSQIVAGTIAGVMGGLTSVWAPPMVVYLAARRTPKDEFVRASGLLIFLGSLPLIAGYLSLGFVSLSEFSGSVLLMVPTFAGFALGERLRNRMSEDRFRQAMLAIFFLMGVNLLRRALF